MILNQTTAEKNAKEFFKNLRDIRLAQSANQSSIKRIDNDLIHVDILQFEIQAIQNNPYILAYSNSFDNTISRYDVHLSSVAIGQSKQNIMNYLRGLSPNRSHEKKIVVSIIQELNRYSIEWNGLADIIVKFLRKDHLDKEDFVMVIYAIKNNVGENKAVKELKRLFMKKLYALYKFDMPLFHIVHMVNKNILNYKTAWPEYDLFHIQYLLTVESD